MIVVPDTNVIVSAFISRTGYEGQVLEAWRRNEIKFAVSSSIVQEYSEVLRRETIRKYTKLTDKKIEKILKAFKYKTIMTPGKKSIVASPDPKDNMFLACAEEAKAHALITGDKRHLLSLKKHMNIPILTPREFVEKVLSVVKTAA